MRRIVRPLAILVLSLAACAPGARVPSSPDAKLASGFAHAFRIDAEGDADAAVQAYLDVVDRAAQAEDDPWQAPALEAALDALAQRSSPSLDVAARDAALAYRTHQAPAIRRALERTISSARGPFARGLVARALLSMAERRGDAAGAETAREATGCAREAIVLGPTAWAPITGVHEPGPLDGATARIEASYPSAGAFAATLHPILVRDRGCFIDLSAESSRPGVREVVVDVAVPSAQTVGLVLRAHGAAVLRAGGAVVIDRPFEQGDGEAARFGRVVVGGGLLRVVARVGTAKDDDSVEIDAFGEDGSPLRTSAPALGSAASARAWNVAAVPIPPPRGDDETLLASTAALAAGDPHEAERTLWTPATRPDARADLALVYARAVQSARDLSAATRAERARSAYDHVLRSWPSSWEAAIGHAVLAGVRHGHDEAGVETLRDLDDLRTTYPAARSPMLDAFEALTAARQKLFDRAQAALARARSPLDGTGLFADAEDAASPRVGSDLAARACDLRRAIAHDTFECLDALRTAGDRTRTAAELDRLRRLFGAPARFLPFEMHEATAAADAAGARRAFDAMLLAEKTLSDLAALHDGNEARSTAASRDALLALAESSHDAPSAVGPLLRATGDDPGREFDVLAERLAAEDRAHPILADASTAVLAHVERYDVSSRGLLHWTLFDVRRVSGTTDVDENAQAAEPDILGRSASRAIRRRILKKDGSILEPDRAPRAAQANADLSQLEQGDAIEAVYDGWAVPSDTGDIGIDTPDLLPDRTAVHDATIELRLPRAVAGSTWSHALLGKAAERFDGDQRVLTWQLHDRPARRLEDGVPKMDRNVAVSFSTARWTSVARALRETVAALDEHDPQVRAWARQAVADPAITSMSDAVAAIVVAAGKALREADAGTLSDYGGGIAPVQTQSARTFLSSHDGSRSWLVLRGLRELGIPADLVVAENDPYSADPSFPPHYGRFVHPLVVAHVPSNAVAEAFGGNTIAPRTSAPIKGMTGTKDIWIDADVAGPPLPAGRVSPELRGRLALHADGTISPLPALDAGRERNEIDVRLALDDRGDARGTFAVVLRGREAQELAEALVRVVGAERQRALREVVLGWLPWANVDDVRLASSEGSWQISLRADVSVSGYAQPEQRTGDRTRTWLLPGLDTVHLSWPRARVSSLAATFATQAGRESALAVSRAIQYHVHRRIELPRGSAVTGMPGPLDVRTGLIDASRTMTFDGGVLEDDFVLGVATGTVPTTGYDDFVGAAHRTDDAFLASTRVSVP